MSVKDKLKPRLVVKMGGSTFIRKIALILRNADSVNYSQHFYHSRRFVSSMRFQATSLIGIIQFLFGLFQVGRLSVLLPPHVVESFTTGAAFYVLTSQVNTFRLYFVNNLTQGKSNAWTWSGSCPTKHARRKD